MGQWMLIKRKRMFYEMYQDLDQRPAGLTLTSKEFVFFSRTMLDEKAKRDMESLKGGG